MAPMLKKRHIQQMLEHQGAIMDLAQWAALLCVRAVTFRAWRSRGLQQWEEWDGVSNVTREMELAQITDRSTIEQMLQRSALLVALAESAGEGAQSSLGPLLKLTERVPSYLKDWDKQIVEEAEPQTSDTVTVDQVIRLAKVLDWTPTQLAEALNKITQEKAGAGSDRAATEDGCGDATDDDGPTGRDH